MSALPICCVTGRIAGDPFACGDCDPCGATHAVPEPVKILIKELDEWADKYAQAQDENEFRKGLVRDALNEVASLQVKIRELESRQDGREALIRSGESDPAATLNCGSAGAPFPHLEERPSTGERSAEVGGHSPRRGQAGGSQ